MPHVFVSGPLTIKKEDTLLKLTDKSQHPGGKHFSFVSALNLNLSTSYLIVTAGQQRRGDSYGPILGQQGSCGNRGHLTSFGVEHRV